MDRSYIVEAQSNEFGTQKDVIAVVFMNSEPTKGFLADFGLFSISNIHEVKPGSKQPTEPTMFLFEQRVSANEIIVKRFDMLGAITNSIKIQGEPHALVPPVTGNADHLLYPTSAYVISGCERKGTRLEPIVAVLFVRPEHGKGALKPDMKTIKRMGIEKINSVDAVSTLIHIPQNTIYLFENSPSASLVTEKKLNIDGTVVKGTEETTHNGEPYSIIPAITGNAADRFVNPRNSLRASDFPRASTIPPAKPITMRPSKFPPADQSEGKRHRT